MTWLYDSHIHLSENEYLPEIDFIIQNMEKMKIKACCVSVDLKTSKLSIELSKKSKLILPFIGLHPEKAVNDLEPIIDLVKKNSDKIKGIGEIGLDKTYSNPENEDSKRQ